MVLALNGYPLCAWVILFCKPQTPCKGVICSALVRCCRLFYYCAIVSRTQLAMIMVVAGRRSEM